MTWDHYLTTNRFLSHKPMESQNHQPPSPLSPRHSRRGAEGQGESTAALLNASSPFCPASPSHSLYFGSEALYFDHTFYSHYGNVEVKEKILSSICW